LSRTKNSVRNVKYAVVGQAAALLASFFARTVFVRALNAEYLGLNGLFANILSILSFAELGIGASIVFSLYKPLAENNRPKVAALMQLFKKAYTIIGIIVAGLGIVLTPFLGSLIKDMPAIPQIHLIFLMFVANSSVSYFFSYKRSLIIADQKDYIASLYHYGFFIALNAAQIAVLLAAKNYFAFLGLQIFSTVLENIFISQKANKLYPFLLKKGAQRLDAEEKKTITRNVKAMMFHKLGTIAVMGTDNLLLSKFVGIVAVGLYSNYLLIVNALHSIFDLVFRAVTASIGNLGATDTEEKSLFIFNCLNLIGFWLYGFVSICLFILINPFIVLWLGAEYRFSMPLVFFIVLNFYLTGMRKSVLTFRDAFGLYWYDRYKPVFESVINLVVSIILVVNIGAAGVFIGTAVSTLTTCFWIEPYVLYKYGLKNKVSGYFAAYGVYSLYAVLAGSVTYAVCAFLPAEGLAAFIIKTAICLLLPNAVFALFFFKKPEFKYIVNVLRQERLGPFAGKERPVRFMK
jgi:O-antigen/teichoic acid export membrane protein